MMTRGQWEQGQGRLEQALTAYRQALALRGVIGSQALVAETHWAISETYHLMGDWQKAADHAEETAKAWREVVKPWAKRQNE
jgi:tetratricopeptide (TPR) repeat protein